MSFHNFIISIFSYIYKKIVYVDKMYKIFNGCDANIERCFTYKIKKNLIENITLILIF